MNDNVQLIFQINLLSKQLHHVKQKVREHGFPIAELESNTGYSRPRAKSARVGTSLENQIKQMQQDNLGYEAGIQEMQEELNELQASLEGVARPATTNMAGDLI